MATSMDNVNSNEKVVDQSTKPKKRMENHDANFFKKVTPSKKTRKDADSQLRNFKNLREEDQFPGDKPISQKTVAKYKHGKAFSMRGVKGRYAEHHLNVKQSKFEHAAKQAARTEFLHTEEPGYLNEDDSYMISQHDIADAVDITSAQKFFELKLDQFGPYRMNYSRNGRFLLIAGNKGHVAAMDWQTKKLMCEMNVMETVQDTRWLHIETMFAVAQKKWTFIYDNQGIELHCLKHLNEVLRMEFLPYHFLLVTSSARGFLSYTDVSVGQKVATIPTREGRLNVMCQNPSNAIIHLGHSGGTVTLWSPNKKTHLVKMLCHGGGIQSLAVDNSGTYMATSGLDRTMKLWDLRTYKQLQSYKVGAAACHLNFSQTDLLSAGIGNVVEVYKDCCKTTVNSPYMKQNMSSPISNMQFCPFEDVLGVGHGNGFSSLLIPGAGEANFDALESNPYENRKQRRNAEVKMLLEKIQPDLISLNPKQLGEVDVMTLEDKVNEHNKLKFLKPQNIDVILKHKKKGRSKAGKIEKRKSGVKFEDKTKQLKNIKKIQANLKVNSNNDEEQSSYVIKNKTVFDRFNKSEKR